MEDTTRIRNMDNLDIPGYRVLEEISRGGMAVVYKALQISLGRYVALKVLNPYLASDPELVKRFQREAKAAAVMKHPNIVTIYDVGEANGYYFIAMEYVKGKSLKEYLSEKGPLSPEEAIRILKDIASALDYAHKRGFVHRDVKPSNVLIDAEMGRALLTDFGVVKALHEGTHLTHTGTFIGTVRYSSPEQIQGKSVGAESDLYSFGVMAYEMLSGRTPFEGGVTAVMHAHVFEPVPPLSSRVRGLPEKVDTVFEKALAKSPGDRYGSAAEFVDDLERVLKGLEMRGVVERAAVVSDEATRVESVVRAGAKVYGGFGECTYLGADALALGKYRVRDCLGVNGFVETYLVEHVESGVWKALKVADRRSYLSDPDGFEAIRQRFRLSAELGQKLEHPNILKEEKFVDEGDRLYLVTEYAPGGSLAKRILEARERGEPIPVDAVVRIGLDVAKGLAYLHERDVVHCDLKPGNVLFGESGRAMVGDLGLVQAPWVSGSRVVMRDKGMKLLSPEYMSPEQWHGSKFLTPASDVYSLGTVLFEALTGRLYKIVKPGTRVRDLREEVPGWLDELIARMLAVDPASRPWDGSEVEKELKAGLDRMEQERREKERLAALKELYRRGKELLDQRKWKEAVAGFEELLKEEPGYEDTEELLAKARKGLQRQVARLEREDRRRAEVKPRREEAASGAPGNKRFVAGIAGIFILLLIGGWFVSKTHPKTTPAAVIRTPAATNAVGQAAAAKFTPKLPTRTPTASPTPTSKPPTATPSPPPTLTPTRTISKSKLAALKRRFGIECVRVPAGEFIMGSPEGDGDNDEHPQHKVYLGDYWIGKTEVTNAQFKAFVEAIGYSEFPYWDRNKPNYPVVGVSWYQAVAFTRWLSEVSGLNVRLPTEAEWEKACRGIDGRRYPWGNEWDVRTVKRLNFADRHTDYAWSDKNADDGYTLTAPVGSYPAGASPYGALDMAGNVWEWTSSLYKPYPYNANDGREDTESSWYRVLRGGSFIGNSWIVRCADRLRFDPREHISDFGFRVVCLPSNGSGN